VSVRRRAVRERVERDRARKAQWDATSASLNRLKALVDTKIAAGDKIITHAEVNAACSASSGSSNSAGSET
jgi:hypothetical protein